MTVDQIYSMLRNDIGSPGDNARTLTKEYIRLKSSNKYNEHHLCKNLLNIRFEMYKNVGISIDSQLTERILEIADGYFPFILFADTFVVNYNNRVNNLEAIMGSLTILLNVIVEEHNKLVSSSEKIEDQEALIFKVATLIKEETGIDLYAE